MSWTFEINWAIQRLITEIINPLFMFTPPSTIVWVHYYSFSLSPVCQTSFPVAFWFITSRSFSAFSPAASATSIEVYCKHQLVPQRLKIISKHSSNKWNASLVFFLPKCFLLFGVLLRTSLHPFSMIYIIFSRVSFQALGHLLGIYSLATSDVL